MSVANVQLQSIGRDLDDIISRPLINVRISLITSPFIMLDVDRGECTIVPAYVISCTGLNTIGRYTFLCDKIIGRLGVCCGRV